EAHTALGDAASLMGQYDVEAEEKSIRDVLAGKQSFEDVVDDASDVAQRKDLSGLWARLLSGDQGSRSEPAVVTAEPAVSEGLYAEPSHFLREALVQVYTQPEQPLADQGGGVGWREHPHEK